MKLDFNKKALAIAVSLALATPVLSTAAFPALNVMAGGFASNPAVAQGHAIPNTDAVSISGNTVTVSLEGAGISDAVKSTTSINIVNNAGATIVATPALNWSGTSGAWTGFSFQLPANWQNLFHNSEQMGIKVTSAVGSSTFSATANKIVNNDTQISIDIPTVGETKLSAKVVGGSLYNNAVAKGLDDYTYEYTIAPKTSATITSAVANSIFNASTSIVALSNTAALTDASGNFTLTLPSGKSVQSISSNDAIYVRRKAKNSNSQFIFVINDVKSAAPAPKVATPSTPGTATKSNADVNKPDKKDTNSNANVNKPDKKDTNTNVVPVATDSNSRRHSHSGGGSGSGSRKHSANISTNTEPNKNPVVNTVTPESPNKAEDAQRGHSATKKAGSKLSVPKTSDTSDMTGSVMMLFGSFIAMGFVASTTRKKED